MFASIEKLVIGAMTIFLTCFADQGVLDEDPMVWLDGARPTPKSTFASIKIAAQNLAKVTVRTSEFAEFFTKKCIR